MPNPLTEHATTLALLSRQNGVTLIPARTPLTRLNYFDGKFLRAADLQAEQSYLRSLVQLSNQADGAGLAHGFDVSLGAGDTLNVGAGLAIDQQGRVLLLPEETNVSIAELIEQSKRINSQAGGAVNRRRRPGGFEDCLIDREEPPVGTLPGSRLYLIVISHTEALCGQEDVYGRLCEEACSTATDRPYRVEGLVIRAVPLQLRTLLATSGVVALTRTHQRSLVASAYFNDEREAISSFISGAGLNSEMWCFGAEPLVGDGVAIAVLAHAGESTIFLDAWTARRERIDTQAKRYWQWRMAMRPWDVFLAQILQFQCQLHDLYRNRPETSDEGDPCGDERQLISEAADAVARLSRYYEQVTDRLTRMDTATRSRFEQETPTLTNGITEIGDLHRRLILARQPGVYQNRVLINGGIVELPSAGYLPVTPGESVTINRQVRRLLGEGVDLRFCIVRPDYVPHALEQAQHMERISLLEGLDHPDRKPEVDILVPGGEVVSERRPRARDIFEATVLFSTRPFSEGQPGTPQFDLNEHMTTPTDAPAPPPTAGRVFPDANQFFRLPREFGSAARRNAFRGAARTELLSTGGAALHLAAIVQNQERETEETTTGDRLPFVGSFHQEVAGLGLAGGAGESEGVNDAAEGAAERERVIVGASRTGPTAAMWLSMRCDRNVLTLEQYETTPVDLSFVFVKARGRLPLIMEAYLRGDFFFEQATNVSNGREVKGRLSVTGTLRKRMGDTEREENKPFNLQATLGLLQSPTGRPVISLRVEDAKNILNASFFAYLAADPLQVEAQLSHIVFSTPVAVFEPTTVLASSLLSNPEVYEADNESHMQALSAIEYISAVLDDTGFAGRASRKLFPPPPPPSEELNVRGTLDWVLFHRRRTVRCSPDAPPRASAATRRYALFLARLIDEDDERGAIGPIREALRNPAGEAAIERLGLRMVAIVEFGAGVSALTSNTEQVKADWQDAHPGAILGYGAILSHGAAAAEGDALAQGRLNMLTRVVSSVSRTGPDSEFDVLTDVPASLAAQGVDGMIVFATMTRQETATVGHSVYLFDDLKALNAAREAIEHLGQFQGTPPDRRIQDILIRFKINEYLGDAMFHPGSADATEESLQAIHDNWHSRISGAAALNAVFISNASEPSPTFDIFKQQTEKIRERINPAHFPAALSEIRGVSTTATLPTNCPVFSIIWAVPTTPSPTTGTAPGTKTPGKPEQTTVSTEPVAEVRLPTENKQPAKKAGRSRKEPADESTEEEKG